MSIIARKLAETASPAILNELLEWIEVPGSEHKVMDIPGFDLLREDDILIIYYEPDQHVRIPVSVLRDQIMIEQGLRKSAGNHNKQYCRYGDPEETF